MSQQDTPGDLEERVRRLEKKEDVKETVQRYVRALDSQNEEMLGSVFAPDATADVIPWGHYDGREEILEMYKGVWEEMPLLNHLPINQVIEVDGDDAVATSYWIARVETIEGQPIKSGGFYERQLTRADGDWVHTYFKCDIQYLHPVDTPSFREVIEVEEDPPYPQDNENHPIPLFPER